MVKILANDGIHPDGKLLLEEAGYQVDTDKIAQGELSKVLPTYDVLIVRSATKVRKELIDQCPNLKVIARAGVGMDNIDVAYAREKGIEVYNTPTASSQSVAELAFAHMFSLARFLHLSNRDMPESGNSEFKLLKKAYSKGFQLHGKTLGVVGFGRIGQAVAGIGIGLGMKVIAVDPSVRETELKVNIYNTDDVKLNVRVDTVSMATVLKKSDFITLHVPGSSPIIGAEEIAQTKQGVILINTARGGAIDENALLDGLDSGQVGGAGLDVFTNEPTPREELLNHPRISVSPHVGASTIEAQSNIGLELADRIIAFYGDDK